MKLKLILFLLTITPLFGYSQNTPDEIVEAFFNDFKNKTVSVALDNLYSSNKWVDTKGSAMISLKEKMKTLTEDFIGKYYGYELLVEKKLADSFILRSYLVKYERQPLRFTFQFYRPNNTWKIHNFKFDGDLDDEVEEAAKLYHFRLN